MRDRCGRNSRRSSGSSGWSSRSDSPAHRSSRSVSPSGGADADALAARFDMIVMHETRYSDQDFAVAPGDGRARPTEAAADGSFSAGGVAALPPSSPPEGRPARPSAQRFSGTLGTPGSFPPAGPNHILGPFLRFSTVMLEEGTAGVWYGSVLVVSRTDGPAPSLELLAEPAGAGNAVSLPTAKPLPLDSHRDCTFWRLELRVPVLPDDDQLVSARTSFDGRDTLECRFVVAARKTPLRIAFYSCNGISPDVKDPNIVNEPEYEHHGCRPKRRLWDDVFERHSSAPFHYMIGGGDQVKIRSRKFSFCQELAWSMGGRGRGAWEGGRRRGEGRPHSFAGVSLLLEHRYTAIWSGRKSSLAWNGWPSLSMIA
ncbi:MAG: hypothetical protein BJ554DRAFT_1429 [Olpidium bornovanus]|uniref:Uncharacterized protein n=1 Tax=Olpidium bornovanus TaxID=278681 RepID=A0A8H7ZS23_9FUNG|nr:MAG: hypothetical protein BJ554DRAFT_1429 [Olpidium bornovanus]